MAEGVREGPDLDRCALEEGNGVLRRRAELQGGLDAGVAPEEVDRAREEGVVVRQLGQHEAVGVLGRKLPIEEVEARNREVAGHDVQRTDPPQGGIRVLADEIRNRLRLAGTPGGVPIVNQHVPIHFLPARINRGQRPRVRKMNVARPITMS